jgi:hypothetical protein
MLFDIPNTSVQGMIISQFLLWRVSMRSISLSNEIKTHFNLIDHK